MLQNISKCSSKYYESIKYILQFSHSKTVIGRCVFVHIRYVEKNGIHLFAKLLEEVGYIKANIHNMRTKGKKFCLFSSQLNNHKNTNILSILEQFNHPKNVFGEYAQIILSSDICMEGYSFHHIQKIFICCPWYNFTRTQQIIARGIRRYSHSYLMKVNNSFKTVSVSLFASICSNNHSIDKNIYQLCKQKYESISKMNKILETCSISTELQNKSVSKLYSTSNCFEIINGFQELNFKHLFYQLYLNLHKNKITFKEFMEHYCLKRSFMINSCDNPHIDIIDSFIFKKISQLFKIKSSYSYISLKHHIKLSDRELIPHLCYIIDNNIILQNKFQQISFLREYCNQYFL